MINKDETQKNDLKIFVSKIEELKQTNELVFEPTLGFGKYKPLFHEKAVEHPAKMNTNLLEFLIKRYTKEGEVILDPMAGTGSTGVLASLHNRSAILVELEKKFVDWIVQAKAKVQTLSTLTPKGEIIVIQGDSRKLSELLSNGQTDIIITSPPYADQMNASSKGGTISPHMQGLISKLSGIPVKEFANNPERFMEAWKIARSKIPHKYSDSPDNIGNLPLGNVDAVITSPPYEGSMEGGSRQTGGIIERTKDPDSDTTVKGRLGIKHSENPNNIGNTKKETYFQAMFQVYKEMYSVLKEGGRAIIVVKPFTRNKKVVDLPYHTWLLLDKVGFRLEDVWKLYLKNLSFWRIKQYKKNPDQEQIKHEYILVVRK